MPFAERYATPQRWLHWIVVALVAIQLSLGLSISPAFLTKDEQLALLLFKLHDGTGATIFVMMLVRAGVRLVKGAPPMPDGTPRWVRLLAGVNHLAFYVLLLVQPVLGYFNNGANGFPLSYYGLFEVPSVIAKDKATATMFSTIYLSVAITIVALIVLHLAGVAYHTVIRRDGLLQRMA